MDTPHLDTKLKCDLHYFIVAMVFGMHNIVLYGDSFRHYRIQLLTIYLSPSYFVVSPESLTLGLSVYSSSLFTFYS